MGGGLTFDIIGSSQVPVLNLDEKRAFTLVVAVSAAGDLLPFQAVFQGKTMQSVPSTTAYSTTGLKQKSSISALSILEHRHTGPTSQL
jgi:hypothetical protein